MTEDHCMFCARIYHMIRKLWIRANPVASFAILLEWNKHLDISELLPLLQRHYLYFHHLLHELPFFLSLTWYDKFKKLWNDLLEVNKQVTEGVTDQDKIFLDEYCFQYPPPASEFVVTPSLVVNDSSLLKQAWVFMESYGTVTEED